MQISQIHKEEPAGDILVFLNGEDEISTAVKDLEESLGSVPGEGIADSVQGFLRLMFHSAGVKC